MKIIIKEAKVIDPKSEFHNQTVDLKIVNGNIEEIAKNLSFSKLF